MVVKEVSVAINVVVLRAALTARNAAAEVTEGSMKLFTFSVSIINV